MHPFEVVSHWRDTTPNGWKLKIPWLEKGVLYGAVWYNIEMFHFYSELHALYHTHDTSNPTRISFFPCSMSGMPCMYISKSLTTVKYDIFFVIVNTPVETDFFRDMARGECPMLTKSPEELDALMTLTMHNKPKLPKQVRKWSSPENHKLLNYKLIMQQNNFVLYWVILIEVFIAITSSLYDWNFHSLRHYDLRNLYSRYSKDTGNWGKNVYIFIRSVRIDRLTVFSARMPITSRLLPVIAPKKFQWHHEVLCHKQIVLDDSRIPWLSIINLFLLDLDKSFSNIFVYSGDVSIKSSGRSNEYLWKLFHKNTDTYTSNMGEKWPGTIGF